MTKYFDPDKPHDSYSVAERKVKRIKGFYTHLAAYVLVNVFIVIHNVSDTPKTEDIWQFQNFSTPFFWGIGLVAHAISVFGQDLVFGSSWEQRQIKKIMEKEKKEKWE